jgi:hypothetical protein
MEKINVYKILAGKPEGKSYFEDLGRRWENNIETDRKEMECRGVDWVYLAEDRDKGRLL